jgi:hypothetical protein
LVAKDARPAEIDPDEHNEIGIPERKVVTVAVATAIDALKRSTTGSGNGVGLRTGTLQTSIDTNGNQTTTLTECAFAKDVTANAPRHHSSAHQCRNAQIVADFLQVNIFPFVAKNRVTRFHLSSGTRVRLAIIFIQRVGSFSNGPISVMGEPERSGPPVEREGHT